MQWTKHHGAGDVDKVFLHCFNVATTVSPTGDIAYGDLCCWEDSPKATTGLTWDQRGMGVIQWPTGGPTARPFQRAGVAETAQRSVGTAVALTTFPLAYGREPMLVQVAGTHPWVKITGNSTIRWGCMASTSLAGAAILTSGLVISATAATSAVEIGNFMGFFWETATSPGNGPVFLRGLL